MTVKELFEVTHHSVTIKICFNGNALTVDKDDLLIQDAFGSYVVEKIYAYEDELELDLKMQPVRK